MKGSAREKSTYVKTKLSFLHPFWELESYYPLRNQVAFDLSLKDPQQILHVDEADTEKYKIVITDLKLRIFFAEFIPQIRNKYVKGFFNCRLIQFQ